MTRVSSEHAVEAGVLTSDAAPATVRSENGRWVKGTPSPHPGGRPRKPNKVRKKEIRLGHRSLEVLGDMLEGKLDGQPVPIDVRERVARYLTDRAFGKPVERTELSGPDGGPLEVDERHAVNVLIARLSRFVPAEPAEAAPAPALPSPGEEDL